MAEQEEPKRERTAVTLFRCDCKNCDEAEKILRSLSKEYGAVLNVTRVDLVPELRSWAGWRTPAVYINGREATHYEVSAKKWREALAAGRAAGPSTVVGEIVDIHCYMNAKAKGEEHAQCARECLKAGQPVGLRTLTGELYLLMKDQAHAAAYESLKEMVSEEIKIVGDVCERGGIRSILVRDAKAVLGGA